MTTALEPGELLTEIQIPAIPVHCGWSYQEVSRRHGDFALAGAAAVIALDTERENCSWPANTHRNNADSRPKCRRIAARRETVRGAFPGRRPARHRNARTGFGHSRQRGIPPQCLRRVGAASPRPSGPTISNIDERNSAMSSRQVRLTINGREYTRRRGAAQTPDGFLARRSRSHRHPCRL